MIAAHAVELADRPVISVATIERRLAAIGRMHREAGYDPPPNRALEVQKVMTGIRRTLGVALAASRTPLSPDELRRLLAGVDPQTLVSGAFVWLNRAGRGRGHAGLDLSRKRLDVQLIAEDGSRSSSLGQRPAL